MFDRPVEMSDYKHNHKPDKLQVMINVGDMSTQCARGAVQIFISNFRHFDTVGIIWWLGVNKHW